MLYHQQASGRAGSWLALRTDGNQWLQVDLRKVSKINIISSQGRADAANWVKTYTIDYSVYGNAFEHYIEGGKRKVMGNQSVIDYNCSLLSAVFMDFPF